MGTFSDGVKKFFNYFSKKYPEYYDKYLNTESSQNSLPLHKENVIDSIVDSLYTAAKLFSPEDFQNSLVVFIVQEGEKNEFDQRSIETQLYEKQ